MNELLGMLLMVVGVGFLGAYFVGVWRDVPGRFLVVFLLMFVILFVGGSVVLSETQPDPCHIYLVAGNHTITLGTIHEHPCGDAYLYGIEAALP